MSTRPGHRPLTVEERRRVRNPDRDHEKWVRLPLAAERLGLTSRQVLDLVDQGELEFEWDPIDAGIYVPVDALPS